MGLPLDEQLNTVPCKIARKNDAERVSTIARWATRELTDNMGRYTYPHIIENGAGERLTFLRRVTGATGDRLEGENVVEPGAGPIMHVHYHQELLGRYGKYADAPEPVHR